MGPSGCGKTTLNCLSGIDDVTSGKIHRGPGDHLDERQLQDQLSSQANGFIFQFYNLLPVLTATGTWFPALIAGTPTGGPQQGLELPDTVGPSRRADRAPTPFPGEAKGDHRPGPVHPAIVWADEPPATWREDLRGGVAMRRLNRENGQTFIIVTHDPEVGASAPHNPHAGRENRDHRRQRGPHRRRDKSAGVKRSPPDRC